MNGISWEEAVRWFRAQPDHAQAVCENYFDLPVQKAAERYAEGEEFAEVLRLLGTGNGRTVLDLGAGNGIASVALARNGWRVTAVEPDPSEEVGTGAIRSLIQDAGIDLSLVQCAGEQLWFPDGAFDAVHARQVFHHASSLEGMARQTARVLRSGGLLLAVREHVADDEEQLASFRAAHPLHRLFGGESAYAHAFVSAGLRLRNVWGPLESILNFYPGTEAERQTVLDRIASAGWGGAGRWLRRVPQFRAMQVKRSTRRDRTPGRLFSFLFEKP